jgi:hypothetical protein
LRGSFVEPIVRTVLGVLARIMAIDIPMFTGARSGIRQYWQHIYGVMKDTSPGAGYAPNVVTVAMILSPPL